MVKLFTFNFLLLQARLIYKDINTASFQKLLTKKIMKEVANNLVGNLYADVVERLYIKNTIDFYDKVPNVELNHKITEV